MVPLTSLWIPILVSAAFVFVVSAIIHMMLPYHRSDYAKVEAEDRLLAAVRELEIAPGDYLAPHAGSAEKMKDPAFVEKITKGPLLILTVAPGGPPSMTKELALWFLYTLVVGTFAAYISGRALAPGAHYLAVFRFAGASAFMGYALALAQASIWYRKKWSTTLKSAFDGLVYALLTAGTFGWLWPRL
jgi:hypothetical protein